MKQIEITVRLNENMQSAIRKLEMQGFKKIRESEIDDVYMTSKLSELNRDNITYKDKEIDEKGDVISEQKINLDCSDLEKAKDLFEHLEFEELIRVRYKVLVYSKDKVEYAFKEVENLGTLIEYENTENFEGKTLEDINKTKEIMYNEIKSTGICLTNEKDVKKAFELILNKYFKKFDK